jgi:hypothetical protein
MAANRWPVEEATVAAVVQGVVSLIAMVFLTSSDERR